MYLFLLLLTCCQELHESADTTDSEFSYRKDFNEHEGAEEWSIEVERKDGARRLSIQFNILISVDDNQPWFLIYLEHSDTTRMNILFDNSLQFAGEKDTLRLSTYDNYYDPYESSLDDEGLSPFEHLAYPVTDEERRFISTLDSTTVILIHSVNGETRIILTDEELRKMNWFYGEVAEEYLFENQSHE